jgi:hypothetical protein
MQNYNFEICMKWYEIEHWRCTHFLFWKVLEFGQGVFHDLKSWKIRFCEFGYGKVMEMYVLVWKDLFCFTCFTNIKLPPKAQAIVNVWLCTFQLCLQHLKPQKLFVVIEFAWKWFWKFRFVGCGKFWKRHGNFDSPSCMNPVKGCEVSKYLADFLVQRNYTSDSRDEQMSASALCRILHFKTWSDNTYFRSIFPQFLERNLTIKNYWIYLAIKCDSVLFQSSNFPQLWRNESLFQYSVCSASGSIILFSVNTSLLQLL